jgi:AcrR family transcriptional regulator
MFFRDLMLTRSEITIASILAAAERLFVARNYADVTMEQIAEEGRLTKGALYHHFESKEELYLAMMFADLNEKRRVLTEAVDFDSTCRERLRQLTKTFLTLPPLKQRVIRLVRRDVNVFDDHTRENLIRAYQRALPEPIERVLSDGIRDGELAPTDPRLLAWYYVTLVEVTLSRYAETQISHVEARLDHVLDLFFHGAAMPHKEAVE